jgi:UDP-N-acetylglucosamine 2-epimerase
MRILTIVGARPQFIKAALVSRAFAESGIDESIIIGSAPIPHAQTQHPVENRVLYRLVSWINHHAWKDGSD